MRDAQRAIAVGLLQPCPSCFCCPLHHHPTLNVASMSMHATMELVLSWNKETLKGSGNPAFFLAASLKARMGSDKEHGVPASKRLMH